jgi:hypothetical protein
MAKPRAASPRRLLTTIAGPRRVRVYRAAFRPFESTKYLNTRALAKARKATIEIGTLEVPGLGVPVAAEVRKDMITRLQPVACPGCPSGKVRAGRLKTVLTEVTRRIEAAQEPYPKFPMPLAISRRTGASIKIGPIVIIYCFGGMPVDCHDTNSIPDGRFAQIAV